MKFSLERLSLYIQVECVQLMVNGCLNDAAAFKEVCRQFINAVCKVSIRKQDDIYLLIGNDASFQGDMGDALSSGSGCHR